MQANTWSVYILSYILVRTSCPSSSWAELSVCSDASVVLDSSLAPVEDVQLPIASAIDLGILAEGRHLAYTLPSRSRPAAIESALCWLYRSHLLLAQEKIKKRKNKK